MTTNGGSSARNSGGPAGGGAALVSAGAAALWPFAVSHHAVPTAAAKPAPHPAPPLYLALDPPFVVNFESEQLVHFLQITVQLMSRDPATIELLKSNVHNDFLS